ncbi:MAG: alpha/beta hydrolase family protein, partial [Parachlamydiaceae bacterium]
MIVSHPRNKKDESRPAFIYFALTGENSLQLDPYNQPVQFLENTPINIYSWSLPGHGPDLHERDAMKWWYDSWKRGEDPIAPFLKESVEYLDQLVSSKSCNPEKIALGGLSRGGYASLRLAAIDSRIKTVVCYAPLTSPSNLDEFGGEIYAPIENEIDKLIQKNIW